MITDAVLSGQMSDESLDLIKLTCSDSTITTATFFTHDNKGLPLEIQASKELNNETGNTPQSREIVICSVKVEHNKSWFGTIIQTQSFL